MKRTPVITATILLISIFIFSCKEKKAAHDTAPYSFTGLTAADVTFASIDTNGYKEDLKLDVYMPHDTIEKKYPLTIYMHGGGFKEGEKADGKNFCEMLADKGFVVASINYRTGWEKGKNPCDLDTLSVKVAVYRALQDAHAAIRFLTANAVAYAADTNWTFLTGSSAGSILSLGTHYYDQQAADAFFGNIADTLGPLYTFGNNYRSESVIKAMAAMWGGLNNPYLLTKDNGVPTIFFHGEKDNVAPWNVDYFYTCKNFFPCYGSKPLYERLDTLGIPVSAYIDPNGGHGVFPTAFRVDKITDFFNGVMHNAVPKGFKIEKPEDIKNMH